MKFIFNTSKFFFIISLAIIDLATLSFLSADKTTFSIGILPVEELFPLIVARDEGLLDEQHLHIDLIPFQSAMERDMAFQAKQCDGILGDVVGAILLKNSGTDVQIINTLSSQKNTNYSNIAILASPNSTIRELQDLKNYEISLSSSTIIEYVVDQILTKKGFDISGIKKNLVPKMPLRLGMLLQDQIPVAAMPQPFATFAIVNGCPVIADDRGYDFFESNLIFHVNVIRQNPSALKKLIHAYNQACHMINEQPNTYREQLFQFLKIPEEVQPHYLMMSYPINQVPSHEQIERVLKWLKQKKLIKKTFVYRDTVYKACLERAPH